MTVIRKAERLARLAHAGQVDKAGNPYIWHPAAVAAAAAAAGECEMVVAACWLHDTVEDTFVDVGFLVDEGFAPELIDVVDRVSRRRGRGASRTWIGSPGRCRRFV